MPHLCCGYFSLESQWKFLYSSSLKKQVLITNGYRIYILVTGFPGKPVCRGSLESSTIVLFRRHGRKALIDVGVFGLRGLLINRLKAGWDFSLVWRRHGADDAN